MPHRPAATHLLEAFDGKQLDPRLTWYAEPRRWALNQDKRCLEIEPDDKTDFWRKTHYGFDADNGHFLHAPMPPAALLSAQIRFSPVHQYDQAGLMIRLGSHDWIKLAIEHETAGPAQLGCVVTQSGYSDWSMQPWTADIPSVWLRIRRMADVYWAEWSAGGKDWTPLRVVKLLADTGNDDVLAGIYACAPKSAGFIAEFRSLVINPVVV